MTTRLQRILIGAFLLTLILAASVRAQTPAPENKVVEIYGQKIYYLEAGSPANPKVILLHGLGGDMNNWSLRSCASSCRRGVKLITDM